MKKSLLLSFCLLFVGNFYAQIVSINENWPNLAWNVSGTYTPAALTSNPTVNSNFAYDTAFVTPSGANTLLYVTSPFFNVKPAFDGNERVLKIQFNIAFTTYVANALYIEYWNADASNWVGFPDGSAPIQTSGNYQTCSFDTSNSPVGVYIDLSSLTINQLQNFRYRFVINGTSSQIGGVCINNVSVNSRSCVAPTGFIVTGFTNTTATFNWNNTDTGALRWDFEYGIQGFVLGTGFIQQTNQVPPYTISGLNPNTSYDIYIKKDCTGDNGIIFSNWTGPLTFTTANLGINTFNADNIALNNSFERNKGSLPWPVDNGAVLNHFGPYKLPSGAVLQNSAVTISSAIGTGVKAVFDGTVILVTEVDDEKYLVTVKHGNYFTSYSNINGVAVKMNQEVKTGQVLGRVASNLDGIGSIDFYSAKGNSDLDPEKWLRRR